MFFRVFQLFSRFFSGRYKIITTCFIGKTRFSKNRHVNYREKHVIFRDVFRHFQCFSVPTVPHTQNIHLQIGSSSISLRETREPVEKTLNHLCVWDCKTRFLPVFRRKLTKLVGKLSFRPHVMQMEKTRNSEIFTFISKFFSCFFV